MTHVYEFIGEVIFKINIAEAEKIKAKVYVNYMKHEILSHITQPTRLRFTLCFLHELLSTVRAMNIWPSAYTRGVHLACTPIFFIMVPPPPPLRTMGITSTTTAPIYVYLVNGRHQPIGYRLYYARNTVCENSWQCLQQRYSMQSHYM